mmetsp:Transcript_104069/g.238301  ORF Transcript_104069/g.238301 Transcript_104069/m.238301 type:complete len:330 (+) Transcript_104069:516-1505(+)
MTYTGWENGLYGATSLQIYLDGPTRAAVAGQYPIGEPETENVFFRELGGPFESLHRMLNADDNTTLAAARLRRCAVVDLSHAEASELVLQYFFPWLRRHKTDDLPSHLRALVSGSTTSSASKLQSSSRRGDRLLQQLSQALRAVLSEELAREVELHEVGVSHLMRLAREVTSRGYRPGYAAPLPSTREWWWTTAGAAECCESLGPVVFHQSQMIERSSVGGVLPSQCSMRARCSSDQAAVQLWCWGLAWTTGNIDAAQLHFDNAMAAAVSASVCCAQMRELAAGWIENYLRWYVAVTSPYRTPPERFLWLSSEDVGVVAGLKGRDWVAQ